MPWKSTYLANLLRIAKSDGLENDREFLALLEAERRLGAKIEDYIAAQSRTAGAEFRDNDEPLDTPDSPLLARRHLLDLYTMALIDQKLSESEARLIDKYVEAARIPEHIAADIRRQAEVRAEELLTAIREGRV